jgi:hypothetical protein
MSAAAVTPFIFKDHKNNEFLVKNNTIIPENIFQTLKGINTLFFKTLSMFQTTAGLMLDGAKFLDYTSKNLKYLQVFIDNAKIWGKVNSITKFTLSTSKIGLKDIPKGGRKIVNLSLKDKKNFGWTILKGIERIFYKSVVFIKDFSSFAFQWFGYLFGLKEVYVILLGNISVVFGGIKNGYSACKGIYKADKYYKKLINREKQEFRDLEEGEYKKGIGKVEKKYEEIRNFTNDKIKSFLIKIKIFKKEEKKSKELSKEEIRKERAKIMKKYFIKKIIYQGIKIAAAFISILALMVLLLGVITSLPALSTTTFWVLGGISGFLVFAAWFFKISRFYTRVVPLQN